MKKEDVINLVNAGFTKDEIAKMFNENSDPKTTEVKAPEKDFEKVLLESKTFQDLANNIADLTKAVKAGNILNSQQPEKKEQSVDDILSEVFNPQPKKGE